MSCIELLKKELHKEFPTIDKDLKSYVESILETSGSDFDSSEEIFEAIGEVLQEVAVNKTEDDIRSLCEKFHTILRPDNNGVDRNRKVLDAPMMMMGLDNTNDANSIDNMTSIWMKQNTDVLKVDAKKLEKAQQKLQQKQERRDGAKPSGPSAVPVLQTASASQVISKKDNKMEAKGTSRSMDIRIENFDVSFGDKVLLTGKICF